MINQSLLNPVDFDNDSDSSSSSDISRSRSSLSSLSSRSRSTNERDQSHDDVSTDESGSDSDDYRDFHNDVILDRELYNNDCEFPPVTVGDIVRLSGPNDERHKYEAQYVRWRPSNDENVSKRLGVVVKLRADGRGDSDDGNGNGNGNGNIDDRLLWNPLKCAVRQPHPYEWYNLNDIIPVLEACFQSMEIMALESFPYTAHSLRMFRCDGRRSPEDTFNWLLMVWNMALLNRHILDNDRLERMTSWSEAMPRALSFGRAVKMLTGPRGLAHGWTGEVPDLTPCLLRPESDSKELTFHWPRRWAADTDTDGSSSYNSASPGCGDSDLDSGPAGVAPGNLPATGFTTGSESDSEDEIFHGREDIGWDRNVQNLTRFDKYMTRANELRRHRRSVRRARRWVRDQYSSERRTTETMYELQAKRAELLASKLIHELYAQEKRNIHRYKYARLLRRGNVLRPNMDLSGRTAAMNAAIMELESQRLPKRVPFTVDYNGYDADDSDTDGSDADTIDDWSTEPLPRVYQTPVMESRPQSLDKITTNMSQNEFVRYIAHGNRVREEVIDVWKKCYQNSSIEMELSRRGKTTLKLNCWISAICPFDKLILGRKNAML